MDLTVQPIIFHSTLLLLVHPLTHSVRVKLTTSMVRKHPSSTSSTSASESVPKPPPFFPSESKSRLPARFWVYPPYRIIDSVYSGEPAWGVNKGLRDHVIALIKSHGSVVINEVIDENDPTDSIREAHYALLPGGPATEYEAEVIFARDHGATALRYEYITQSDRLAIERGAQFKPIPVEHFLVPAPKSPRGTVRISFTEEDETLLVETMAEEKSGEKAFKKLGALRVSFSTHLSSIDFVMSSDPFLLLQTPDSGHPPLSWQGYYKANKTKLDKLIRTIKREQRGEVKKAKEERQKVRREERKQAEAESQALEEARFAVGSGDDEEEEVRRSSSKRKVRRSSSKGKA